jgi:hypothetical protein
MNKTIRVVLAIVFLAGFVAIGMNGTAWADKLNTGNPSPMEDVSGVALARPHGTVETTPTCIKTNKPGKFVIGSIATWVIQKVPDGGTYTACVAKEKDLPRRSSGHLLSSGIIIRMNTGNSFDIVQQICYPVVPGKDGYAYYWDGSNWIKTDDVENGVACVVVPLVSPNPTYVGMWTVK